MKKRLLKAAIATALSLAFAVPAFANPFTDVPAKHWAYESVNKLAKAGIIDGFSDGTFRGDKTISRYEMASIVAKAMNKSLNNDQKAMVDKLSREFAAELNAMGIKVDGIEQKVDGMVKVSGDARARYFNTKDTNDFSDYRARISFDGKISDNLKFNARVSSGNADVEGNANTVAMDTANVNFNALALNNTVGRQDITLGTGYIIDTQMNGITSKYGALKMYAGNSLVNNTNTKRIYGAEYNTNILGAVFTADYMKNVGEDKNVYGVNTSFGIVDGVAANAEYVKNGDAKATAYGLKFTKLGLGITHRDSEVGAFTQLSTMNNGYAFDSSMIANGFKGMEYTYDRDLDKNTALNIMYQDFDKKDGTKLGSRTVATVKVKF